MATLVAMPVHSVRAIVENITGRVVLIYYQRAFIKAVLRPYLTTGCCSVQL
jgi:hypothetical protein